ncbi:unnamed protein product [Clonostachys rosea]|uniref:Uncharacterized protein n=1 Tax=Bionectria ochroleuca TaxID=29856 RepID=A0ABY6U9H4_BIOOC|nr:unnamed protein product [Clonostachys rosea]
MEKSLTKAFCQYTGIIKPKRSFRNIEQDIYTVGILWNARELIIYDDASEIWRHGIHWHVKEGNCGIFKAKNGLPVELRDPLDIITKDLESLSGDFKKLEDITFVGKLADWSWLMGDEYRVHGPEVVTKPLEGFPNPRESDGTKSQDEYGNMGEQFQELGISDDSGIKSQTFSGSTLPPREQWNVRPSWQEVLGERSPKPKIGRHGFSYNSSSCGGVWAGFRLYLGDQPRLEFSPLRWEDVKQYTYSFRTSPDHHPSPSFIKGYLNGGKSAHFPQCIVKLDIIRPGELPHWTSSHDCWEPVTGAFDSSIGDLRGVDWRIPVEFSVPHPSWGPEEYTDPGFDEPLSQGHQKELGYLNKCRLLALFNLVVMQSLY